MKLSVAMCTYNGAAYLREQLDSIAGQSRPPDELIIVDDCSNDSTPGIIREFAHQVSFPVDLHENDKNIGSTRSFDRAIRLCSGDVIVLSDQDDVWLTNKLQAIEKCFLDSPSTGLVFSDAKLVDQDLKPLGRRLWNQVGFNESQKELIRHDRALNVLLAGLTVTGATMAFRSEFVDLVLPVPEKVSVIHDGWIALVIAAVAKVTFIDRPMILYRQHEKQQVGAPKAILDRKGLNKTPFLSNRIKSANTYDHLIENLEALIERIRSTNQSPAISTALEGRLKHLKTRQNLNSRGLKRITPVLTELISSRYHHYSSGFGSAAKDLLKSSSES